MPDLCYLCNKKKPIFASGWRKGGWRPRLNGVTWWTCHDCFALEKRKTEETITEQLRLDQERQMKLQIRKRKEEEAKKRKEEEEERKFSALLVSEKQSKALDIMEAFEIWVNNREKGRLWHEYVEATEGEWDGYEEREKGWYLLAKSIAKKIDYTSSDILKSSEQLGASFDLDALVSGRLPSPGYFLSALVNLAREDEVTLDVRGCRDYMGYLDDFGYLNEKKLRIKGDVGDKLGRMMKKGEIIVDGNAGSYVGEHMEGGIIVVKRNVGYGAGSSMSKGEIRIGGDAGEALGLSMGGGAIVLAGNATGGVGLGMRGGTIVVEGDAGWGVGADMVGGEIRVNGTIGRIGYDERPHLELHEMMPKGGKIYEKGNQVYSGA